MYHKKKSGLIIFLISLIFSSCNLFRPQPVYDYVFLGDYQPFKEKTKAVKLTEPSALKLTDNLPKIDGATALYPLYAAFVQAVYPEDEYYRHGKYSSEHESNIGPVVACYGTSSAYNSLINGKVDIIFCAEPSDEQLDEAAENGISFNLTPIGKEAFVFFVNNKNKISDITTEQIRGIYSGKITNWKELGGKNNDIRIFQRAKNSGSQTMFLSVMGDTSILPPVTENILTFMLDMVEVTADYRNYSSAIGYSFLFYTAEMVNNKKIKILSINGIAPSAKTIQTGEYQYTDYFYAITANTENENVNKFIEWILSEQGQYLVSKTGYVSIYHNE